MDRTPIYRQLIQALGGPVKAAQELGVKQGTASGYQLGDHGMSAHVAMRAERITRGKFKAADLCEKLADLEADTAA